MPVSFGYSIGDIIGAIGLVVDVLRALQESNGSAARFRSLMARLNSLDMTINAFEKFGCDDAAVTASLTTAVELLKEIIAKFRLEVGKYEPSLKVGGSTNKVKDVYRKIRWAFIKQDIATFHLELIAYKL